MSLLRSATAIGALLVAVAHSSAYAQETATPAWMTTGVPFIAKDAMQEPK